MKLYDHIISDTQQLLSFSEPRRWSYSPDKAWPKTKSSELVLQRDAAFELGGGEKKSANYACLTEDESFVDKDEILLFGRDLNELKEDTPYARIAVISVENMGEEGEELYKAIRDIDFVKYHVFPKGFMMRTSPDSFKEQVRIDRKELKRGMSFESIGADFISRFKEEPNIKHVKLIFITDGAADFDALCSNAKSVDGITKTLTHIMEGLSTDCSTCQLKALCDEVEGMRELHFKHDKKSSH